MPDAPLPRIFVSLFLSANVVVLALVGGLSLAANLTMNAIVYFAGAAIFLGLLWLHEGRAPEAVHV